MNALQAIKAEYSKRERLLSRHQYRALSAMTTEALSDELKRLRNNQREYQADALKNPTPCAEMADPHWCVEASFFAHVPGYVAEAQSLDPYLRTVFKETLDSAAFRDRFELDLRPDTYIRGDDGDAGILDRLEDNDGHDRGGLVGIAFWDRNPDHAEIHVSENATALIILHEASHLLHYEGEHGEEWRTSFRDLVTARYGTAVAPVFDSAINNTDTCMHGSIRHKTTDTGDNE